MITYWNRALGREETELVYGDALVQFLYGNKIGFTLADKILSQPWISKAYGHYQSSRLSRTKIPSFIRQFQIPMDEYEKGPFASFNDFFIRRFLPEKRTFIASPERMPAFCEARYLAFASITEQSIATVKGISLNPLELLSSPEANNFLGGPGFIARLCPVDYHRFHFPDRGHMLSSRTVQGKLHSVNPLALAAKPDIFLTNERAVHILQTENFGKLAYIEVGALCVGRIVQTHQENFQRGEEKGYFLFGGSTVIVLGEPGAWIPDADLLEHSAKGQETLIRLGEAIAKRC